MAAPSALPHLDRRPSMAPAPAMAKDSRKLDISNLMSPPDAILDSFSHNTAAAMVNPPESARPGITSSTKHPLPMSPPVSPYSKPVPTVDAPTTPPSQSIKDPVLYPTEDGAVASPPQPPLFAAEIEDHRHIIDDHVRAQSPSTFGAVTPPKREDYMLVLAFRSQVMKHFTANRRGWLLKERALLKADRQAGAGSGISTHRYHTIMPAKPIAAKPPRSQRADRVSKPQSAPRPIRSSNGTAVTSTSTPTTTHGGSPVRPSGRVSATPEPSRRSVAPNREDKDFNALPDYCPPLDSLPGRPNSLKVDWKGQPIDLSNDPHAHRLHPDEVTLAGNLRLDCATYLTSKRRIFERRLQCLRTGKEFRKTDAQQACKIDVNKASKLWTAFDKVGWLDAAWVRRFL
ncbi:SWIRM domain-containing protein [Paramyrothecium foliicola]|nr:SWIRM domain-containing protein [Paramyrothecium foliicola]